MWIFEQFHGISSALHHIPKPRLNQEGKRIFGRHGDLKPQNDLWFPSDGDDESRGHRVLKITYFGLTEFSRTEEPQSVGDSIAMTIIYRPPELDDIEGMISQSFDIWTMGCMFLEFITWYLLGKKGVHDFVRERCTDDPSLGIASDAFFTIQNKTSGSSYVGMVKPAVLEISLFSTVGFVSFLRYLTIFAFASYTFNTFHDSFNQLFLVGCKTSS